MTATPQTEAQLVRSLQAGEVTALAYLYTAYSPILFGVLLNIHNDRANAEDLLHDAFIKIWVNIHQYNPDQGRLFTWMVSITRNIARSHNRAQKVRYDAVPYLLHRTTDRTEANGPEGLVNQPVLSLLAPQYGQIIELIYQGYSREEIAESCKLPLGTVKTRLRTGLLKLKALLRQDIHHYHGCGGIN